jgi:hypothetical protein
MAKRWMLSVLLFIVGFGACAMPVYAVPWSEYVPGQTNGKYTRSVSYRITDAEAISFMKRRLFAADDTGLARRNVPRGIFSACLNIRAPLLKRGSFRCFPG